ncbi:MAG: hypothetical protein HZA04_04830 [Nitrospinae bacterium]|nr:hypothetical protein [Nitrospinota bacterium]
MASIVQVEKGKDEKQEPAAPPPVIPPSLTTPLFIKGFKELLSTFLGKMVASGVPRDKLNKALSEMPPEIQRIAAGMNATFLEGVADYLRRKEQEELRNDYLGRALVYDIEKLFPPDHETARKLTTEPVKGMLPYQVADGLIAALKAAHGLDTIKEYSQTCKAKAEQYRSEADFLIDIEKFVNDPDVKRITTDVTTRFKLLMHKKPEADQRKWILNQIHTSFSFREMKRDLSEEELGTITHTFLKAK